MALGSHDGQKLSAVPKIGTIAPNWVMSCHNVLKTKKKL